MGLTKLFRISAIAAAMARYEPGQYINNKNKKGYDCSIDAKKKRKRKTERLSRRINRK